jgi:hypothetical protein
LPTLSATLAWREVVTMQTWSLTVVPRLPGDYNANGIVDAADYVVWRKSAGNLPTSLAADGSGPSGSPDGIVDEIDRQFWRANFGNLLQTPSSGTVVPEPSLMTLAILIGTIGVTSRARLRRN